MAKILIIDKSRALCNQLHERLAHEGITSESVDDDAAAIELCHRFAFDAILTENEIRLPGVDTPFVVVAHTPTVDSAILALRNGALDYLPLPVDMNRLLHLLRGLPERMQATEGMIGDSEKMKQLMELIEKVARNDARVLITGENGSGKELVARHLHAQSNRSGGPFVEVNCAAIPSELIESELFGHERGAFTSAIKQKKGKFELAHGGTLFLDEIGDMSRAAQAKVLRTLQERKIGRVGGDKEIDVDVRIIAATNKNLHDEIRKGTFREDLFHRLAVILIEVPPLREHPEDIPTLVDHFIGVACAENRIPRKQIHPEAIDALSKRHWPGNIRELRNIVERLVVLCDVEISAEDVEMYCY